MNANYKNDHNFSAGPGALPKAVLDGLQQAVQDVPGIGMSIFGVSHRSEWVREIIHETKTRIRRLASLPNDWEVLFLPGGATLQFTMAHLNLGVTPSTNVGFVKSGYWSAKAIAESASVCRSTVLWDGETHGYSCLPNDIVIAGSMAAGVRCVQYTSNETVDGVQFKRALSLSDDAFKVCDVSSDFLTREFDYSAHDIVYAHAQKNIGPTGLTIVLLSPRAVAESRRHKRELVPMLSYAVHLDHDSVYNTPPVFEIYAAYLSTGWLIDTFGDLRGVGAFSAAKAQMVYDSLESAPDVFSVAANEVDRSMSNVVFDVQDTMLARRFACASAEREFYGIEGHRSRGGFRVSLYNGVGIEATRNFSKFVREFAGDVL